MPDMTDEEYDAPDEYYTRNPPKVDPARRGGIFTRSVNCWTRLPPAISGHGRRRITNCPSKSSHCPPVFASLG
jgi:hypothetical protein